MLKEKHTRNPKPETMAPWTDKANRFEWPRDFISSSIDALETLELVGRNLDHLWSDMTDFMFLKDDMTEWEFNRATDRVDLIGRMFSECMKRLTDYREVARIEVDERTMEILAKKDAIVLKDPASGRCYCYVVRSTKVKNSEESREGHS